MRDDFGLPEIHEGEARGDLRLLYEDIKYVLKVPIVNFIFRTLACYDKFLFKAWGEVRRNMLTLNAEKAAQSIRQPRISVEIPKINLLKYYNKAEIEEIRKIVFVFRYVNTKLLIMASAWAESLGSRPVSGGAKVEGYIAPGIYKGLTQIKMVDITETALPLRKLLLDISEKHHAYDVASDFRALAYYPEFLRIGWSFLKPYVGTDEYNTMTSKIKSRAVELAHEMPFPVTVHREQLEKMYSQRDIAGIMGLVSMFQDFLAPLVIDLEFLRRIIYRGE
jgi:hypothetical protein